MLVGTPTKVIVGVEQTCVCYRTDFPYDHIACRLLVDEVQGNVTGTKQMARHADLWEYTNGEWFYGFSEMIEQCRPKDDQ